MPFAGVIREYVRSVAANSTPEARKISIAVAGQMGVCVLLFAYVLLGRYTHHKKGLFALLACVGITVATRIAGDLVLTGRKKGGEKKGEKEGEKEGQKVQYYSARTVGGLLLVYTAIFYALMHILTRQWVFPQHWHDLHDYQFR